MSQQEHTQLALAVKGQGRKGPVVCGQPPGLPSRTFLGLGAGVPCELLEPLGKLRLSFSLLVENQLTPPGAVIFFMGPLHPKVYQLRKWFQKMACT